MSFRNAFTHGKLSCDAGSVWLSFFQGTPRKQELTDDYLTKVETCLLAAHEKAREIEIKVGAIEIAQNPDEMPQQEVSGSAEGQVPKYEKDQLFRLLCQIETLQHSRIYYFLVAETIFILAAVAALAAPVVFVILSLGGLLTAFIFTFTNVKLYWRILWLIRQLERVDPLYDDYLNFKSFDKLVSLSPLSRSLRILLESKPNQKASQWHHTGFLYTWGLFWVIVATWIALLIYGIVKCAG